ncbi:uncharacterized protein DNG_01749 [Cephalotrichum gorgonifer]|uniref:Uncharacterized protein n=1 Tax=Cephalotrichum gorgonifer TaxID=2041049 RepID=A0AAE8SSJ2_9PEZI|nr:uncharacterized protein DNG_01749 [Cephalotrichum gorgonifer]
MSLIARAIHEKTISGHKERLDGMRQLLLSRMPVEEQRRFASMYPLPYQNAQELTELAPPPQPEDAIEGLRNSQSPLWGSWGSEDNSWPDVESALDDWRGFNMEAANNFGLDTMGDVGSGSVNSAESEAMDEVDSEFEPYFDGDPMDLDDSHNDRGNGKPGGPSGSVEMMNGEHSFDDNHSTRHDCGSHIDTMDFDLDHEPISSASSSHDSTEDVAVFSDGEAEDYCRPSTSTANSTPPPLSFDKPTTFFSHGLPSTTAETLLAFERAYNKVYHVRRCLWRRREAIENRIARRFIAAGSMKLYGGPKRLVGSPLRNEIRPEDVEDQAWPRQPSWGALQRQVWV